MSIALPNFITDVYLQDILDKNSNESGNLEIKSFWGEWATKKGDNYASEMYRIHVNFEINDEIKTKSILLKVNFC